MKAIKKFKELGIQPESKGFEGDKISMDRILNREITVHDYRIENSKYPEKGNAKCLYMQITIGDNKHVLFSGSKVLQDEIQRVSKDDFPFATTIVKENRRFEFT
ncbi:hypothetical protein [Dyadobacter sp. Leaf189]|uniref:hypothetical protein n=1 Tax=Dyadobacter sp. Leaf189 TaxID=1736295 RepID=UPI0006F1EE52|nr:hypothetical protein [Dyadobacter sp. Leaf189]KQS34006.1 hypothetical protein ASG33_08220 [Dyadobacter sp. Leaf189]